MTTEPGRRREWSGEVHHEHELLWCEGRPLTAEAAGQVWFVPPSLAVWLPAGTVHCVGASPVGAESIDLRLSRDPALREVTRRVLAAPGDDRSLDGWASTIGVSSRTSTGMTRAAYSRIQDGGGR